MDAPPTPLVQAVLGLFLFSAVLITAYTCNFYYLAARSSRRRAAAATAPPSTPGVTVHLPVYNERYVAARLVRAVCSMDWPRDRLRVMVIDDSDDETADLMAGLVSEYRARGHRIEHVRRGTRDGYKAGALRHAMASTDTEYVAIFDADFIPPPWFLRRVMPHFSKPDIGLLQCRWGHANEDYSSMTRAQALSLDFHFLVEQKAKSDSSLFMNFNGTAGVWRRECIEDSGGWHSATLVEDLDLSYRAQMRGWRCVFLPDVVVDAELPVQMNAAKRQQFRWAKGSIQCAIKQMSSIAARRGIEAATKLQAFVQLTRHVVFPLVLVQFLALPVLLAAGVNLYAVGLLPALTLALYFAMGPLAYALVMRGMYGGAWGSKARVLPALMVYSAGMAVNNTVAVFDAVLGKRNEFLRTPKYGITSRGDSWADKAYNLPFTKTTLLEAFFCVYGVYGMLVAVFTSNPVFVPIIGVQTAGFFYVAYLSLAHSRFKRVKAARAGPRPRRERMADAVQRAILAGMLAVIAVGGYAAVEGYRADIYPLDVSRGLLSSVVTTSDPAAAAGHLRAVMAALPEEGNPVWIFPTEATSFARMQADLAVMLDGVERIAAVPSDSSAFHTGMLDVKERATALQMQIVEATPYMYVSVSNMLFSAIWVAVILGIFAALKRKRDMMARHDERGGP